MAKPKVIGYVALHYGKDYLGYAIKSMYGCCDEILILYSESSSHGSRTNATCPDTMEELVSIVEEVDVDEKCKWRTGHWTQENQQRNFAHDYAKSKGYDILVCTDADEVWRSEELLWELIMLTFERKANKCLVWMRHLWRSFDWICDDPMRQERIHYLGGDAGDLIYAPNPINQVWHFGYARKPSDIKYKISIHGHSAEWLQPKEKWFADKFMPFPPTDNVHPVCENVWHPKPFAKEELPEIMKSHPWYNTKVING